LESYRKYLMYGWDPAGKVLVEGKGCIVKDIDGKEYLDCASQAFVLNVGYSHPEVLKAVTEQMRKLSHCIEEFDTPPRLKLAKKLAEIAPGKLKKCHFSTSGGDAVESALKLAMLNMKRHKFITLYDGYHGRTLATMAASYPHTHNWFAPFMEHFVRVPNPYCYRCVFKLEYPGCDLLCAEQIDVTISKAAENVGAVLLEPVQGNGGSITPPKEYLPTVRKICDKYGLLLIFDEIQTAFGRVGKMFAAQLYQTIPDIMVFGKALGGGFPLSGIIARENLEPFGSGDDATTFANNPVSCAAALANLEIIERENLAKHAAEMGNYITTRLRELQGKYPLIGDIRGPGLMTAAELVEDPATKKPAPDEAGRLCEEGLKRGVIFGRNRYAGKGNVVKIKPPLNIEKEQVDKIIDVFEESLKTVT